MSKHLTPIAVLERLIGPLDVLAAITGVHGKTPYLWRRASKWRDEGDLPSPRLQRRMLAHAAARNIPLTANHLIFGAAADEIDRLLAEMNDGSVTPEAAE